MKRAQAAVAALGFSRRPSLAPRPLPPTIARSARTFSYDPTYLRRLRKRALWVSVPMALCLLVLVALPAHAWFKHPDNFFYRFVFGTLEPLVLAMVLLISVTARKAREWYRELRLESGPDGLKITYARISGAVTSQRISWSRVYWSAHMLLVGNVLVTLTDSQVGDRFEREPLESYILSRVPERNRLSYFAFIRHAIANRNPEFTVGLASFVGALIWALVDLVVKSGWLGAHL